MLVQIAPVKGGMTLLLILLHSPYIALLDGRL